VPVTCLYANMRVAGDAIRALQAEGVDPRAISVLTRQPDDTDSLEQTTGVSDDLEDASVHRGRLASFVDWLGKVESAAVPGFGAMLGTGDLWQDIQVAGKGRGAITGALVGAGIPVDEAARLEEAVQAGQTLVVVDGDYDQTSLNRALGRT
jgi:hypothetical protein